MVWHAIKCPATKLARGRRTNYEDGGFHAFICGLRRWQPRAKEPEPGCDLSELSLHGNTSSNAGC